jgi:Pectinacetylesterase
MNLRRSLIASCIAGGVVSGCSPPPKGNVSGPSSPASGDAVVGGENGGSGAGGGSAGPREADASLPPPPGVAVDDASPGDASGGPPNVGPIVRAPITGSTCAPNNFTQTSFVNLAVARGAPLDPTGGDVIPAGDGGSATVPAGWHFYLIDGAVCRDGSPSGIYVRYSPSGSRKLMIYLEGGGACISPHFCDHNPANLHQFFPGGPAQGESFSAVVAANMNDFVLQQPYTTGTFDDTNDENPFKDWNRVYVPYCTGDVHFGTAENVVMDDGLGGTRHLQFVGHRNMQKIIARVAPTFAAVDQVILTGTSAGGLGAVLNYGLVQDSFGSVPVSVIDDSGPAFADPMYLATCLQKELRELWGWDASLPSDCQECRPADGGGLINIVSYWLHKVPGARIGLISSIHDQIFRLFYSAGMGGCASNDPNILSGLGLQGSDPPQYPGPLFASALDSLRATYSCTKAFGSYYIGAADPDASTSNGAIDTLHMHTFRNRFYEPLAGGITLAKWTSDFVAGAPVANVGP